MTFTDKALSIITFAAYHSLASGEVVREVLLEDGHGHKADPDGLDELLSAGAVEIESDKARFTEAGDAHLAAVIASIRDTIF